MSGFSPRARGGRTRGSRAPGGARGAPLLVQEEGRGEGGRQVDEVGGEKRTVLRMSWLVGQVAPQEAMPPRPE